VKTLPLIPVFGDGKKIEQPIHISELVDFLHQAIHSSESGQTVEVGGHDPITFNELVKTIGSVFNKQVRLCHLPATPLIGTVKFLEKLKLPLGITSEQICHLDEDLSVDMTRALSLYNVKLSPFEEHLVSYRRALL